MNNPLQTCRSLHQTWGTLLTESEQEIDQLLNLLEELPDNNYQTLQERTANFAQTLSQLRSRMQHLQHDVVCAGTHCSSLEVTSSSCPDLHFLLPATGNPLIAAVTLEYGLIKERCQAFLGELMRLNII
ncbi:MAG: hypothetical protein JWP57_2217 [Spirosoma sp.]|nr:hypothetical protein [Spirosoma sp.]